MAVEDRLAMAKRLIRFLPTTNLFRRNPYLNDHVTGGDAGLYDLRTQWHAMAEYRWLDVDDGGSKQGFATSYRPRATVFAVNPDDIGWLVRHPLHSVSKRNASESRRSGCVYP